MNPITLLSENGNFLCKLWDGKRRDEFIELLKPRFDRVKILKPNASRDDSAEIYIYASRFKPHFA